MSYTSSNILDLDSLRLRASEVPAGSIQEHMRKQYFLLKDIFFQSKRVRDKPPRLVKVHSQEEEVLKAQARQPEDLAK